MECGDGRGSDGKTFCLGKERGLQVKTVNVCSLVRGKLLRWNITREVTDETGQRSHHLEKFFWEEFDWSRLANPDFTWYVMQVGTAAEN